MMEEVAQLCQSKLEAAAERLQQAAIERFSSGGEIWRLMHPSLPVLHTLALRTNLPNNFIVAGEALQMARFRTGLEGRELAS